MIVRDAVANDANAITALINELGYEGAPEDIGPRLALQHRIGTPALVAIAGDVLAGCLTWHVTPVIHRPKPVGRITMLVVPESWRGQGVGTRLVHAAVERLCAAGCGLIEVTSNIRRERAHQFYEGLGFERTSFRFAQMVPV